MRRWFVICLIVLLPWRAWAGNAMALVMTAPASAAGAAVHCAELVLQTAETGHGADTASTTDAPTPHAVCDSCNGPALSAAPGLAVDSGPLPQAHPRIAPVRFASALPRTGLKPPIA